MSVIAAAAALILAMAAPAVAASGQMITVRAVLSLVCATLKLNAPADLICAYISWPAWVIASASANSQSVDVINISFLLVVGKLDANNFVDRYQYRNCTYKVLDNQILLKLSVGVELQLQICFQSLKPLFNLCQF